MAITPPPALSHSALGALAALLLVSGIDDSIPLLFWLKEQLRPSKESVSPGNNESARPERGIAIFVPCWHEAAVIGNTVRHNLATIRYRNFDFLLGVYPNDEATVAAASQLASEFSNVHVAACGNPGPTSKADCLNWIFRRMQLVEKEQSRFFDTIILHDAEDMIHPQALSAIDRERANYEMVQVPVLPLKTGFSDVTHGVYCDEFAEYQTIEMPARQISGSFVPSNGVGTGFAREVLDRLARERDGAVFDPASLTEDYEIGVHIHAMGYRQTFLPLARAQAAGCSTKQKRNSADLAATGESVVREFPRRSAQDFVATREFFPRSLKSAIRQRTRWVTGIALQCWERHGWQGSWRTRYWFWRDRKGLIANPLSVVANAVFIAGLLDFFGSTALRRPWLFENENPTVALLCSITMALQCFRLALRSACVGRIFGWKTALGVPLRSFHANLINGTASLRAVYFYFRAKLQKRSLAWHKTEHAYPHRDDLHAHRRELGEVLVGCGYLSEDQMQEAREQLTEESTLDLLLLSKGLLSEEELCKAMSLQSGLAAARIDTATLNARVVRGLPAHIEKRYGVLPFEVRSGKLLLASSRVPPQSVFEEIEKLTHLPVELQLVTQSTYDDLRELL